MVVYRQLLLKDIQTAQVTATHLHLVSKIAPSEVKQQIFKDVTLPLMEEMAEEVKSRYGQQTYFFLLFLLFLFFCRKSNIGSKIDESVTIPGGKIVIN